MTMTNMFSMTTGRLIGGQPDLLLSMHRREQDVLELRLAPHRRLEKRSSIAPREKKGGIRPDASKSIGVHSAPCSDGS